MEKEDRTQLEAEVKQLTQELEQKKAELAKRKQSQPERFSDRDGEKQEGYSRGAVLRILQYLAWNRHRKAVICGVIAFIFAVIVAIVDVIISWEISRETGIQRLFLVIIASLPPIIIEFILETVCSTTTWTTTTIVCFPTILIFLLVLYYSLSFTFGKYGQLMILAEGFLVSYNIALAIVIGLIFRTLTKKG